jgi:hypothetical protein
LNRTFPVSSLSFFILPCLVIFALNYVSVSFDISKKNGFWNKTSPIMESSGSTSEIHVHCRTVWSLVNCWIRTTISVVDCVKLSVLVNKCFSHSCTLGGATYHGEKHPGTHHIKCHFCSTSFSCVVSHYLLGSLGDSNYFLSRMLLSYDMNQMYMVVGPLRYTNAL